MSADGQAVIKQVLAVIQAISDVCREDKHAFLKDACANVPQQLEVATTADEMANSLYYPCNIASRLQSKSEQRLFVYAAQGTHLLLSSSLVSADTMFTPPSVARTERKTGLFRTKDVSTPHASSQQLDVDGAPAETSLLHTIISTMEWRSNVFRSDGSHSISHTPAEDAVFTEQLKSLALLMTKQAFGLDKRRTLRCFQLSIICTVELRPFDAKTDPSVKEILPGVVSTFLARATSNEMSAAAAAVADPAEKPDSAAVPDLAVLNVAIFILDAVCTAPKDTRDDYLLVHLSRVFRLFLLVRCCEEFTDTLTAAPLFAAIFAKKACPFILYSVASQNSDSYIQGLRILQIIIRRHSALLKSKIHFFILGLIVPYLDCEQVSLEKKEELLSFLQSVVGVPTVLAEWFINFDCQVCTPSLVGQLMTKLSTLRILRSDNSTTRRLVPKLYAVFLAVSQVMATLSHMPAENNEDSSPASPLVRRFPKEVQSAAVLRKMVHQKAKFNQAVSLFNEARNYNAAIQLASEISGLMDNTSPYAVAHFLMSCDALNPAEVGNFLCRNDPATVAILHAFIDLHDFSSIPLDEAVRLFLGSFRIGGEAQAVERTMDAFADAYCHQNPGAVPRAAAGVLAFSIVMLNVDAHSSHVKDKMTPEQYINNVRSTPEARECSSSMLGNIYKRITAREIVTWKQFPAYMLVTRDQRGQAVGHAALASSNEMRMCDSAAHSVALNVQSEKIVTTVRTPAIAGAVFDSIWSTLLPVFSVPLEESSDKGIIDVCLNGISHCVEVACRQERQSELKAFLFALLTFSHLTSLRSMQEKNVRAATILIQTAYDHGDKLGDGWEEVLRCVSRIGHAGGVELVCEKHSRHVEAKPTMFPDISVTDAVRSIAINSAAGGGLSRVGSRQRVDIMAADTIEAVGKVNITTLFQHVSKDSINKIFTVNAKSLRSSALLCMMRSLCKLVREDIVHPPTGTFMLRYAVDVLEANFARRLSVWIDLWDPVARLAVLLVNTTTNEHQALYAVRCLRKFTIAQIEDDEMHRDDALVASIFELFQAVTDKCPFASVLEMVAGFLAMLVGSRPARLTAAWRAIIATLMRCYTRMPEMRVDVAGTLHAVSTRCLTRLCAVPENLTRLFRAWVAVARGEPDLERYALAHIRLLIASLFHVDDPCRLDRAAALLGREAADATYPPPPPAAAANGPLPFAPSVAILQKATRFLDEDACGALPPFAQCLIGFNELVALAASFQAGDSLAEAAMDTLLEASAAFRARVQRGRPAGWGRGNASPQQQQQQRTQGQVQWELVYSQCVLSLVDVYVNACTFPPSVAATTGTEASGAAGGTTSPPPPALIRTASSRPAARRSGRSGSPAEHQQQQHYLRPRTTKEVSRLAVGLLEKLVAMLIKQELTIREEEREDGEEGSDAQEEDEEEGGQRGGAGPEQQRQQQGSGGDTPVLVDEAGNPVQDSPRDTVVETGDVIAELDLADTASAAGDTFDSSPVDTRFSMDSHSPAVSTASGIAALGGLGVLRGGGGGDSPESDGRETAENVLDEDRHDEVAEVNLNLVERLLTGLCPCPNERIRNLGFLALRKLISSRLACAVSATNQAEMTELALKLNASLQAFFQEHVVDRCLRPPHLSSFSQSSCPRAPAAESAEVRHPFLMHRMGSEIADDALAAALSSLPSEGALRACVSFVDLLDMVLQQEVYVASSGSDAGEADDNTNTNTLISSGVPSTQYQCVLDEATTAGILKHFRDVYVSASRLLSLEYFSTLSSKDGLCRAAGERILAMIITLECSISNVFIEMEVSREPAASQPTSPAMSAASPTRAAFAANNMHGFSSMGSFAAMGSPAAVRPPGRTTTTFTPGRGSGGQPIIATILALNSPPNVSPLPAAMVQQLGSPSTLASATRNPIEFQVEKFRNFVLDAFLKASRDAKRPASQQYAATQNINNNSSLANQQQLMATRTVVRSFLESLQHAPTRIVRRVLPKYRTELCELIKSCDEEIAPLLSDILLRYLSGI